MEHVDAGATAAAVSHSPMKGTSVRHLVVKVGASASSQEALCPLLKSVELHSSSTRGMNQTCIDK